MAFDWLQPVAAPDPSGDVQELGKLEKLEVIAYSDVERQKLVGRFVTMFNPQTFTETVGAKFTAPQGENNAVRLAKFRGLAAGSFKLQLLFDGTNVGVTGPAASPKPVKKWVSELVALTYRVNGSTHEPNYLKVHWGSFDIPCRLDGLTITYTSFDRAGEPLRAELDLSLLYDEDPKKQRARLALSSPDLTHSRVVRGADTLPRLTTEIYGSPAYYLRVARANGLDHFRRLAPGQTLLFPPLAR